MLSTLDRAARWAAPFLASTAFAAALAYMMTTVVASAPVRQVPTSVVISDMCVKGADPMLVYAVTTHRVPADIMGGCRNPDGPMRA
jgi:hypothetical protein